MKTLISVLILIMITALGLAQYKNTEQLQKPLRQPVSLMERNYSEPDSTAAYVGITNLDSFLIEAMNSKHIPGLAACIVKDTSIIWTGSYGYANIQEDRKVADSTVFMLASTSKTITSVALMQLYEDGLFALDDDINNYLPWPIIHPGFPDSTITFRMLMTHTSAIKDNWDVMPYHSGDSPISLSDYLKDYLTPDGSYYDPNNNFYNYYPGSQFNYCNIAVALCGYLVEAIADIPFDQFCQQNLFTPLNMNETSWFLAGLNTNNIAMPYQYINNTYEPIGHYGYSDYPDGQLRTSTLQLARFLIAFMEMGEIDGIRILDSSTVESMTTVQHESINSNQGLIWYKTGIGRRRVWGHEGGDKGVGTAMFYSPEENTGAIILANKTAAHTSCMNELFEYALRYNEIYPYDYTLNDGYMAASKDTLAITMHFYNPKNNNFSAYAIIKNPENSIVDSIPLLDDGNHGDEDVNDGIWGNFILPVPIEQAFMVGVSTTNLDIGRYFILDDLLRFTTIGPIVYENHTFASPDPQPNPGDRIGLELTLKNTSTMATATNIRAGLISLDSLVSASDYSVSFGNIAAGESSKSSSIYLIEISEECPVNTPISIMAEITSDGYKFWSDTFTIMVQEPVNIEDLREPTAKIYPNPTDNILNIEISNTSKQGLEIEILDITGKVIYQKEYGNISAHFIEQLDLSGYAKGIYLIKIKQAYTAYVGKVIVR